MPYSKPPNRTILPSIHHVLVALLFVWALLPWILWSLGVAGSPLQMLDPSAPFGLDFTAYYHPQAVHFAARTPEFVRGWIGTPFLALVLQPFLRPAQISPLSAWTLFNLVACGLLVTQCRSLIPARGAAGWTIPLALVSSSLPVLHSLKWGQISLVVVVLAVEGLRRGGVLGGALVGIAGALKIYPLGWALQPLIRRNIKATGAVALSAFSLGFVLPALWLGIPRTLSYFDNISRQVSGMELLPGGQNLYASATRWYLAITSEYPNSEQPGIEAVAMKIAAFPVVLAAIAILWLSLRRAKDASSASGIPAATILIGYGLMISPGWVHYYSFLPFCQLVAWQANSSSPRLRWLVIVAIAIERLPLPWLGCNASLFSAYVFWGGTTVAALLTWCALVASGEPRATLRAQQTVTTSV